ncbi:MAG: hypothetical protein A2X78_03270 [Gammaproteobacteria bacterium GWE2_37_16]|nr:MAG: hypothetical protein A2X78_03270 [Gammaproteobacteria bacterium GWE2_37_16]
MNKIYVGNLPFKTTDQELQEVFAQFGELDEIALIKDRYSGEFKGFGFITFKSQEAAQNSLAMDGKPFGGRPMKVSMARENDRKAGGGDRRPGGGGDRRPGGRSSGGGRSERW